MMGQIDRTSKFADTNKVMVSAATKIKENDVINNIINIIKAPFSITSWIAGNWQLAVIGVVAIFILIRD